MSRSSPTRIAAVIPAAGASSRLGRPKQLIELEGQPLVVRAVTIARAAGCDPVVVVLGAHAAEVAAALADCPATAVVNPGWKQGMGSSVAAGVGAVTGEADAVLILPCDLVAVGAGDLRRLLAAFVNAGAGRATAAAYARTVGVPAIFPAARFPELRRLAGDRGARDLLRGDRGVVTVSLPAAERDVDTPDDVSGGPPDAR